MLVMDFGSINGIAWNTLHIVGAELQARRDQPVDVQVGADLWEDAPQELRSRLWIALLCNPHLIGNLIEEKAGHPLLVNAQ